LYFNGTEKEERKRKLMNLMNITDQLFFAVLISTATGTLVLFVWLLLRGLLLRINPMLAYILLRWINVLFIVPFGYFAVLPHYREWIQGDGGIWRLLFAHTDELVVIMRRFGMIWFCIACFLVIYRSIQTMKFNYRLRDNVPMYDSKPHIVFDDVCKNLDISSSKVTLKKNALLGIPMIYKAVRPEIVLPEGDYTREQLKCFFYHELAHYRHRDLWGKGLAVAITTLHCFNPAAYLQLYLVDIWSEYLSDLSAIQHVYLKIDMYSIKRYYELILDVIPSDEDNRVEHDIKEKKFKFIASVMFESTKSLKKRIDFMKNYKKFGECGKFVIFPLVIAFILMTTTTAFVTGNTVADFHNDYYQATEDVLCEGDAISEDGITEYCCEIEDFDTEGLNIITEKSVFFSLYKPIYDENLKVNPDTRHVCGYIIAEAGGMISVSSVDKSLDKTYALGIVDDDGHVRYIVGTGVLSHNFKISMTNHYWVFIQNNYEDVTLSVSVRFTYEN